MTGQSRHGRVGATVMGGDSVAPNQRSSRQQIGRSGATESKKRRETGADGKSPGDVREAGDSNTTKRSRLVLHDNPNLEDVGKD